METLKSTVALQEVLNLIFRILLRESSNEELSRSIIHLGGNYSHGDRVNHRDWTSWLDLRVFVELGWSADPKHDVIVANSVELDSGRCFLHGPELEKDEFLLRVLA